MWCLVCYWITCRKRTDELDERDKLMIKYGIPSLAERVVWNAARAAEVPAQGGIDGPMFFDDSSDLSFTSDDSSSVDRTEEDHRLRNLFNVIRNSAFVNVSQL